MFIVIVVVGAGIVRQERFLRSKFLHFPVTSRNIMHFSIRTRRSMNRSFKKIPLLFTAIPISFQSPDDILIIVYVYDL